MSRSQDFLDRLHLEMHDLSVNSDPDIALRGRMAKALMPPYMDFIEAEMDRGTGLDGLQEVMVAYADCVLGTLIHAYVLPRHRLKAVKQTILQLTKYMLRSQESARAKEKAKSDV